MPIIDLQRRLAEIGRIRIGQQVPTNNGKSRPEKLDTFRLTSADKVRIDHAAGIYGGTPQQWQAPAGQQWEVVTQASALDVIVPPSDMAFSQHYELWSAGGCQRRCDGMTEAITQGPCLCDPEQRACDIHTRLSVMLRDLPGLGVWRIDTSGYYAAVELQGAVQVIQVAAGQGRMLPARLRLEQRMVKRTVDGKSQTRRFAVPVLDVEVSPGELMARPQTAEVRTPQQAAQLDGSARLTPVPASLPAGPSRSVAEQVAEVDRDAPQPSRRNAAQAIPETGLRPRTAAAAEADEPAPDMATAQQITKLGINLRELGIKERADAVAWVSRVAGREVKSRKLLTKAEISHCIDVSEAEKAARARTESEPDDNPGFSGDQQELA